MSLAGIKAVGRVILPRSTRQWIRTQQRRFEHFSPRRWCAPFGNLHRVTPYRPVYGYGHGQCIDRYYIENFLARHAGDIHGRVLEVADNTYTRRFGGTRVVRSEVLHVTQGNPQATIIADLSCADHAIPSEIFDCIILTQTLELIYDVRAAIRTLYRILKPDGTLLATFPGIRNVTRYDMERWGDHWRFTTISSAKLFGEVFPKHCVSVRAYGNVLATIAFLHGVVSEEMTRDELDYYDQNYELLITLRAVKPSKPI